MENREATTGSKREKGNYRLKSGKDSAVNVMLLNDARIFGDWCSFNVTIRLIKTQKLVILRS